MLGMSGKNPKEKKTRRKFEPENKNNAVRLVELEKSIYQRGCYRVRYVGGNIIKPK